MLDEHAALRRGALDLLVVVCGELVAEVRVLEHVLSSTVAVSLQSALRPPDDIGRMPYLSGRGD